MKSCLIIGGSVLLAGIVAVVLLFVFVFGATGPVVDAADAMVAKLGAGNVDGAYESAAASLKEQNSLEDFKGFVEMVGLVGMKDAKWASRGFDNNTGYVEGTVETSGGTRGIRMETIKEGGEHRVYLIKTLPVPGGSGGGGEGNGEQEGEGGVAATMPSGEEIEALLEKTLVLLNQCILDDDFGALYGASSSLLRQAVSEEELASKFAGLVSAQVRTNVGGMKPIYAEGSPQLLDGNRLEAIGHYQAGAVRLDFGLGYVREGGEWLPMQISVNLLNE